MRWFVRRHRILVVSVVVCVLTAIAGFSLQRSSFAWAGLSDRWGMRDLIVKERRWRLPVRRVGLSVEVDPSAWRDEAKYLDVIGTVEILFQIPDEVHGLIRSRRVIGYGVFVSYSTDLTEAGRNRVFGSPPQVFDDTGAFALRIADDRSLTIAERHLLAMLREPPGRRHIWIADEIAREVSCGAGVVSVTASLIGLLAIALRATGYLRRVRATECIACGYPIEKGTDRCPECGGLRPVWRNVGTKRE